MEKFQGEFYHVFNRGVEKRDIFMDDEDYFRFIHDLYEFNDKDLVINFGHFVDSQIIRGFSIDKAIQNFREMVRSKNRKLLVYITCFCLMPNHFHLVVSPLIKNGLSIFMQKLGTGYTRYFNYKYQRVGSLFQGTYKAKHIPDDTYFMHCTGYVHRNPLGLMPFDGEKKGKRLRESAGSFLRKYRWSSYPDAIGEKNFPSVVNLDFLMKMFANDPRSYEKFVLDWTESDFNRLKEAKLTLD